MSARIRGSKSDLEELGEDTEDLAEGFSKYANEIKALTGFDIMVDDTHFKDLYDIMEGISKVWDTLSDTSQARVAEILGGTRQLQVISSIIGNWSDAAGAYETAMNSAGASTKANDIYMQDVAAHINQFKAAFEELSMTMMKSNVLTFFIDAGKGLVSFITSLEKMHLLLPALITSLVAIKGIKMGAEAVKASAAVSSLVTKIVNEKAVTDQLAVSVMGLTLKQRQALATQIQARVAAGALTAEEGQQILATLGLATADGTLAVANKGLAASFKSVMASIPVWGWIALGVSLVIELIGWLSSSVNETEDKLQGAVDELDNTKSEIESINSELKTTKDRIDELNRKDKLTLVEQNELERLQKVNAELERKLELEKAHKSAQSTTVVDEAMKDFNKLNAGGDVPGLSQILSYQDNPSEDSRKKLEDYYQEIVKIKKALEDVDPDALTPDAEDALDFANKFEDMYMVAFGDAESLNVIFNDLFNSEKFKNARSALEQLYKSGNLTKDIIQSIYTYGLIDNREGFILPNPLQNFSAEQLQNLHDLLRYLQDIGLIKYDDLESGFAGFVNQFEVFNDKQEEAAKKAQAVTEDISKLKEALDGAQNAFSTVSSAITEYQETGVLNSETLSKLISLEPEYLNLLMDENGQLNLNSESYERLIKSKLENMVVSRMQSAFDQIMQMSVEEAQAYATATAYDTQSESIYSLLGARMKLAMSDAMEKDRANNTDAYSRAVMRTAEAYAPLVGAVEDYNIQSETATKNTKDNTKATNDQKQALEAQKKALEDSKKSLEEYKNDLTDAKAAIESLIDAVSDYIKQQKEDEKLALQERKDAFDELIEKEKEELEAKKESAKFDEELAKKQNTVAKNALAASVASLDDSSAGRKAQKQANDALNESQSDLASTLADHEHDIRIAALDQLKEQSNEYYDSEIKKISDYLSNTRQLYEDACSMIENDTGNLYYKLWEYTYQHTTKTHAEFDFMWNQAKAALERYGVSQLGVIGVMEYLQSSIYNTEQQINNLEGTISNLSTSISNVADSVNSLANNSLTNVAAKISDIREEYRKLLEQMRQQAAPKWYYWWQGTKYESSFDDKDTAISDIKHKIESRYGGVFPASAATVDGMIKHYASGTNSAAGGLSLVGERGAELRVLNSGDGILKNQIVRGLTSLGTDPGQFIADAGKKLLSSLFGNSSNPSFSAIGSNNQPINIVNNIQGDVNPSTLKALVAAQKQIIQESVKTIQKQSLSLRTLNRI